MTIDVMDAGDDMFEGGAEALVVPVNCVGVLGAGLARTFAGRWPAMVRPYEHACARRAEAIKNREEIPEDALDIGRVQVIELQDTTLVCLPTKDHWRHNSRLEDVMSGIVALAVEVEKRQWRRVAVPALGCGLGKLPWELVLKALEDTFLLTPTHVLIYPPR